MKKIISVMLCIILGLSMSIIAFAEEGDAIAGSLSAQSAILMEISSGEVLMSKNPDEKLPPASITKIMALLLVMEALDEGKISPVDYYDIQNLQADTNLRNALSGKAEAKSETQKTSMPVKPKRNPFNF